MFYFFYFQRVGDIVKLVDGESIMQWISFYDNYFFVV